VEFGQLAIVVVLLPLVFLLRASAYYRLAMPAGSLAIGGIALAWFVERDV
jgi:hypothetical protein